MEGNKNSCKLRFGKQVEATVTQTTKKHKRLYTKSKGQTSDTRLRVKKSKAPDGIRYPFYYASKEVNASTQPVMNVDQQTTQLADESNKGDTVRGPALMRKIWKQKASVRIPNSVNEHGQPICKNSSKLTHFLGNLTRSYQYCPVIDRGIKLKHTQKDKLLNFLRTKFDFPQTADSWILQSYGRKMKNWRARIKEAYFDLSLSMDVQLNSLPKELTKRHWRRLLEYWSRERVKAMSDKNKANRANKKLTQLTGKKSFARIHEELKTSFGREPTRVDMFKKCFTNGSADGEAATVLKQLKELTEKLVDGQTDTPGPDDVFS
ncbi:uncharacterized protein [Rutidosis leptorrhynchoides]|uniref:uncharacterized protein n=1 Tax=Rutidosis leptorrhynchoides TaxID=125765 RepID=UPI003A98FD61